MVKAHDGLCLLLDGAEHEITPVPFPIKRRATRRYTRPAKSELASNYSSALNMYSFDHSVRGR